MSDRVSQTARHRPPLIPAALAGMLLLALSSVGSAQPAEPPALSATVVRDYAIEAPQPLFMPTDVAVDPEGAVYVVDGVHDRVVRFGQDGRVAEEITGIGDTPLQNPLNAVVDSRGALWVADAGSGRVLERRADGTPGRVIDLTAHESGLDLADVALGVDEQFLWLTDNDHHQLLRYDLNTEQIRPFGTLGESLGEFQYPYTLVTTPRGEVLVTDVLNGRVQRLDANGVPVGSVGTYGVEPGQLYRPKGVAVDSDGNVWISDGTLNVVQVFTPDGRLIGVLRSPDGAPLRFALPMGLAFDANGALYVTELEAHRVRKLDVTRNRTAPPPGASQRRRLSSTGPQARACTLCHFEWMRPLVDGISTELADVPPNPASHPWVSRPVMCLGCHDGSVGDSRQRVWVEHGHRIGIVPPADVTIPADLPLADGKIACRTCHSAHTAPESRTTVEEIVFLRVDGEPAELCTRCHTDYTEGVDNGMHPQVKMPIEMPDPLVHLDTEQSRTHVTCLACHSGHGATHDHLLVLDTGNNALCLECHAAMEPAVFSDATRSAHGRLPKLDETQHAIADQFHGRVGEHETLLCVTCHMSHHAPTPHDLLAFDPSAQDTCAACHPHRAGVVGSPHDLRTNHPEVRNVAGILPTVGGACSGCHTAHRDGVKPNPTELDPRGQCTNCHIASGLAASKTLHDENHPETACRDCHDPHTARFGSFLVAPPSEHCTSCHTNMDGVANGPHDATRPAAQDWPASAAATADTCLACHRPHGTAKTGLFRIAPATGYTRADGVCLGCHADSAPDSQSDIAMLHPRDTSALTAAHGLPLDWVDAGTKQIGCHTCHDPHAGTAVAEPLLRVEAAAEAEDLCFKCHTQRSNIHMIGHAEAPLAAAGFKVGGCRPCHATHHDPQGIEARYMWRNSLSDYPGADEVPVANHYCIACHREGGPVAPPRIATHPAAEMYDPTDEDAPGHLPLFNAAGEVDPRGSIACRTCHLTHGRSTPAPVPKTLAGDMSSRELRARAWHVRSFGPANVCTTCHGYDALRRFMYFHDPARRTGPIEGGR